MPKRIYAPYEPCDKCKTPTVQGKNGFYCKPCYIAYKEGQKQTGTWTPPTPQNAPQASFDPDKKALEEKVATLEMALANMRVWASKVEKRLSGVETIIEGMQMNKEALPLHQSFTPRDVHEIKTPDDAAAIVDSYKSDPTIPTINEVPKDFDIIEG